MGTLDHFWHRTLGRPYKLRMNDEGQGEPLVLLHGLGASGAIWQPLVQRLSPARWRVIRLDLLGFGDSPKPTWNNYTVEDQTRAIIATLKKRRIKKPVTIVGHSMGCLVAIHIAAAYPQWVKQLVLYAPPLFADDPLYKKHARRRARHFTFFTFVAEHPQLGILQSHWLWRFMRYLSGLELDEERWLPFERSLRNTIMQQRAYHQLLAVRVPVTIVHARLDFLVTRAEVAAMLKANPLITLVAITGMHGISQIAAKKLAALIEAE